MRAQCDTAARSAATATAAKAAQPTVRTPPAPDLFARHTRAYSADCVGRPVAILQAGATTASDLGADALRASGSDIVVSLIDEDEPVTREAVAKHPDLAGCILSDLRTVPLNPRAFDIIQCASLLGRIKHAELVLDRLIGAIRPGGLLLLRIGDRESAGGFLDRKLPETLCG
jgi:hypothetical protein